MLLDSLIVKVYNNQMEEALKQIQKILEDNKAELIVEHTIRIAPKRVPVITPEVVKENENIVDKKVA